MAEGATVYFEDLKESQDLGRLALRGATASVAMQYGNGVLQIVAAVVLARLLAPEDFGLVAIVTVLTSFAPLLIDFGLTDATIQRSKVTRSQVSSLFWLSSGIGLAVAVFVAACSPLIAWMYGDPRLEAIAVYFAITFVLVWAVSPAPSAFTTNNAICENCQNTDPRHVGRTCRRHFCCNLGFWLLGVSAASDCKRALGCYGSVVGVPMEARLPDP